MRAIIAVLAALGGGVILARARLDGVEPALLAESRPSRRELHDPAAGRRVHHRLHAVEPRIDPRPDNPHIADLVLRARRR
jgi:hypothetical protein